MAANRTVKVAYLANLWSNFSNLSVYSGVFKVSELIELVWEMIGCQGHSQKVIFKVKYEKKTPGRKAFRWLIYETGFL